MSSYEKPRPRINPDNARFWESAREGVLRLPRCRACGAWHWPPGPVCPDCLSERIGWRRASGRGVVSTWTRVHKAWFPTFETEIPYVVIQVELTERVRLTAGLVDCPAEALRVGMEVKVVFERVAETLTLPKFRPLHH